MLKTAEHKLCKAIISKCNKELVNCISEWVLNVLNCNIKLTGCDTRKLQKHKARFARLPTGTCLSQGRNNSQFSAGDFCCLYSAPSYRRSLASSYETDKIMLRKMYLIPAERLHGSPPMQRNREKQVKKRERVKKRKHDPYAEAVKIRKHHPMRCGLRCVKKWTRQILEICEFLSLVMPTWQASKVYPPPPTP